MKSYAEKLALLAISAELYNDDEGGPVAVSEMLKPCPFCGGKASFGTMPTFRGDDAYFVSCSDCLASTNILVPDVAAESKEEAAMVWNRREQT